VLCSGQENCHHVCLLSPRLLVLFLVSHWMIFYVILKAAEKCYLCCTTEEVIEWFRCKAFAWKVFNWIHSAGVSLEMSGCNSLCTVNQRALCLQFKIRSFVPVSIKQRSWGSMFLQCVDCVVSGKKSFNMS